MKIVQATPDHYQGIAALYNTLDPERNTSSLELMEGDRQRDPKFKFQRMIAFEKDQMVGIGY
jgi:hypothetical protein